MKSVLAGLACLLCVSTASAATDPIVRWDGMAGVITALNVDNPAADVHSGTFAWSARTGHARVNLYTGAASFNVQGLAINGTAFSGTPGPVTQVTGTLVCNPGESTEEILDTANVSLSAQGDADFVGFIAYVPATCNNPLFLIRIAVPTGAAGRWIATGTERSISVE